METDQKTPGQVLYEADAARVRWPRKWWHLLDATRALWEADAAAVLAHDRANQPAASGVWIPVSERLPEPFTEVLVYPPPSDYTLTACHNKGEWTYGEYETGFGHVSHQTGVTHWLPIPAAPEAPKP